jgi:hypothetical protein
MMMTYDSYITEGIKFDVIRTLVAAFKNPTRKSPTCTAETRKE